MRERSNDHFWKKGELKQGGEAGGGELKDRINRINRMNQSI
jgi:hypothetical protein